MTIKEEELQNNLDKTKKENNDLYNRIAKLIEAHKKEVKNLSNCPASSFPLIIFLPVFLP